MRRVIFPSLLLLINSMGLHLWAQNSTVITWNLAQCIAHATANSIPVKRTELQVSTSKLDVTNSRSAWLPTLSASVTEDLNNSLGTNSTGFSLSSNMPLYKGGAIRYGIKRSYLALEQANLNVEEAQNNITISVVQAYLNILYAKESADYYSEVVKSSQKQVDRVRELHSAGSATRKEVAQLEAQLASDNHSLTTARNSLISKTTTLKQLLELSISEQFEVTFPEISLNDSTVILPSLPEATNKALEVMPEIKSSMLGTSIAKANLSIAKADYYPSLSLNAGYSTNYTSTLNQDFGSQLSTNQYKKLGVTLGIPIFNRSSTRINVQQSRIDIDKAQLSYNETEKNLTQKVENAHQETTASLSRYKSAKEKMEAAAESYKLSEEQFNLGILNTTELLEAKTLLLEAESELIQSKYATVLKIKILDFYTGKPITL